MKIVHICMFQYSDGWTYQENMLAKYHKKLGHEVTLITSMYCYNNNNCLVEDNKTEFFDINGVKIIRLKKKNNGILGKMPVYDRFYETVEKESPDIVFSHGCQYKDEINIVKYVKLHPETKLFVDNHADFSNTATSWISKNILHKMIWKYYIKKMVSVTEKFWGVLPARVDFLKDIYGVPQEKCGLLLMGADDDLVRATLLDNSKKQLRQKYGIQDSDFLVMTGGKIDKSKCQTAYLMEAVSKISDSRVKLIVFGNIAAEMKDELMKWVDGKKVIYAGWINPDESYSYFAAADLVVFPGRHSVFWEQVAGQGIPLICKRWPKTEHVNIGGNAMFISDDSMKEIKDIITSLVNNAQMYASMKKAAVDVAMKEFSYENIARKAIDSNR